MSTTVTNPGAGKIVKAASVQRDEEFGLQRVLKRELYAARLNALEVARLAEIHAAQVARQAQAERKTVLEKGYHDGYSDGLGKWNDALVQAWRSRDEAFQQNEADVIKLAVRMAERIFGEQLKLDPTTIVRVVREALKSVRRDKNLVIFVHASEVEMVRRNVDTLVPLIGGSRDIEVKVGAQVSQGGCIVESELGVIDARVETQLERLEKALTRTDHR